MSTTRTTDLNSLLVVRPDYREGRPCLRGTGITVHAVGAGYSLGYSAADICAQNPDLDPSLFYAALAYYLANREQIDAELDQDDIEGERLAAEYPNGITPETFRGARVKPAIPPSRRAASRSDAVGVRRGDSRRRARSV